MKNTNKQICHYFNTRYGCKYGINCQYSHQTIPSESSELIDKGGTTSKSKHDILSREQRRPFSATQSISDCSTQQYQHDVLPAQPKLICHYFQTFGSCKFGKYCQFEHTVPNYDPSFEAAGQLSAASESRHGERNVRNRRSDFVRKPAKCRYFSAGNCRFGENCKFYHPNVRVVYQKYRKENGSAVRSQSQSKTDVAPDNPVLSGASHDERHGDIKDGQQLSRAPRYVPRLLPAKIDKSNVTEDEIKKLRGSECERIKRRFTKDLLDVLSEAEDVCEYRVKFQPTDPDWPFDIKIFDLVISIPKDYPAVLFSITVPKDQDLPETVRRFIEISVDEWIQSKRSNTVVELLFLPFLRWLDRNLEEIVTNGLRQLKRELIAHAAGFQFIPAADLVKSRTTNTGSGDDDGGEEEEEENDDEEPDEDSEESSEETNKENRDNSQSADQDSGSASRDNDARRGTEILLRNLQLVENAATLLLQKAYFIVQCSRCKHRSEFSTPAGRQNQVICGKCNNVQLIKFRSVLAHQFSAVVGYLDLNGCTAFDLILHDSNVTIGCLNCSKDTQVQGLHPGTGRDMWCHSCHQKMRIVTENPRFQQLKPTLNTADDQAFNIPVNKIKKLPKDPAIQEGRPLPDLGTCKHYKKSFRWLRFPCCGKAYPCDVCHNEKETDHEMKYANRMICGHCCKEQPYAAERPCTACSSNMTKGHTMHWEGGKGCRDKITMSRGDAQKYANVNKTISRKTKDKNEPKSKKKNKE